MSIILSILLIITIIIAFMLFLALVTKKQYSIERDITIARTSEEIFEYIKLVKNQEQYNFWVMRDPNVKIEYSGVDGKKGFISAWEGDKKAGKGEQEIKSVEDNKSIHLELRFEKPFKNVGQTYLKTKACSEKETLVTWQMTGENKFPLNLMNLIIDGLLGKDLEKSLKNLKLILESNY